MKTTLRLGLLLIALVSVTTSCGGTSKVRLAGSPDVPAAAGVVKASTTKNGNTKLEVTVAHLASPERVSPGATVYVVWLRGLESGAQAVSQGALAVDKNLNGEIATVTPLRTFDLFITAETSQSVTGPGGRTLLSTRIEMK